MRDARVGVGVAGAVDKEANAVAEVPVAETQAPLALAVPAPAGVAQVDRQDATPVVPGP